MAESTDKDAVGLRAGAPATGLHRLLTREALLQLGLHLACVALLVGLALWLRWPVTKTADGFRNEDVAGITYNADLLRHGKVPLKDSLEIKAPGSFFVTWAVWAIWGRSMVVLECFGIALAILAGLGVFFTARVMFGLGSAFVAGLIYTIWSPITDSLTVNYNSWMIAPYVWATGLFVLGLKRGSLGWLAGAGALLSWSALFKHQGAALVPLFAGVLFLGPALEAPVGWARLPRLRSLVAFFGGIALGFVPIGLYYLVNGGLSEFVRTFFFSEAGWRYVGGELELKAKFERMEDGFLGFWEYMALPTLLACMTLASAPIARRRGWSLLGTLLGAHLLMSFLAVAIGFRFYMGYYLQALPAAAWLAAHPNGPLLRFAPRATWPDGLWPKLSRLALIFCLVLACLPPLMADLTDLKSVRRHRPTYNDYQIEAQRIAKFIKDNSAPTDEIWVWGRWAWPVYYHAERLSAIRYYKVLGVITTNLTNTWKRPTEMTRFVKMGPWLEIAQQLKAKRPPFIVVSNNESLFGYDLFLKFVWSDYAAVPGVPTQAFNFYYRKDFKLKTVTPPPPAPPPPPAAPGVKADGRRVSRGLTTVPGSELRRVRPAGDPTPAVKRQRDEVKARLEKRRREKKPEAPTTPPTKKAL
ncbi:MAG: glycosyltransferase family 39 protein [Deltaproteobacteria bacterium]|nr:glycosyltransferase family 39 protein [Deltaproteobacteria bacterium]